MLAAPRSAGVASTSTWKELVRLYGGDGFTHSGGIFASGVPTTVREAVPSFSQQAGRKEPKEHLVDGFNSVS